jgi:hypothetical protein
MASSEKTFIQECVVNMVGGQTTMGLGREINLWLLHDGVITCGAATSL